MLDCILIVLCVWNVLECFDLFLDFCLDLFLDFFLDFFRIVVECLDLFRIVVECLDLFLDFFLSCVVVAAVILCSLLTVLACVAKGVNNTKVISIIAAKIKYFFKCVTKFRCNSFIISSPN